MSDARSCTASPIISCTSRTIGALVSSTSSPPPPAEKQSGRGAKAYPHVQNHCHRVPATGRTPEVFFAHDGAFDAQPAWYFNTIYRREQERGYPGLEDLWMPGVVKYKLAPAQSVHFACSTDPIGSCRKRVPSRRNSSGSPVARKR